MFQTIAPSSAPSATLDQATRDQVVAELLKAWIVAEVCDARVDCGELHTVTLCGFRLCKHFDRLLIIAEIVICEGRLISERIGVAANVGVSYKLVELCESISVLIRAIGNLKFDYLPPGVAYTAPAVRHLSMKRVQSPFAVERGRVDPPFDLEGRNKARVDVKSFLTFDDGFTVAAAHEIHDRSRRLDRRRTRVEALSYLGLADRFDGPVHRGERQSKPVMCLSVRRI